MIPAEPSPDEAKRIEALLKYSLLDTLPEDALDDLTAMAAQVCGTPIALISLVDENRQWFKSKYHLDISESSRDISFCAHAIRQSDIMIVPDTLLDPRFADNPTVIGEPHIRFYAGAQLITPEGHALGTLCVLDKVPRTLTPVQRQVLRTLARQVMTHLELRRKTSELARTQEQLQLVTSKARVGLFMVDRQRRYVYANKAYADIMGLSSSDIVGRHMQDVLSDVYEDQIRPRADAAFEGQRVEYELHRAWPEGNRYYLVRYEPIWEAEVVTLAIVVITDITEHRRLEESLRLAHERLELVSRATNDAVWDWNIADNSLWWNDSYQLLFGYPPEEIGPSLDSWTSHIHPEDFQRVWDGIQEALRLPVHSWSDEYRYQRHDGAYAWVFDRGYVMRAADGMAVRMIGAMQDITQWKLAEERISEQAALLDQARDAIFVRNLEGKILFWSKGAERTYGWQAAEVMGRNIAEVLYVDAASFAQINQDVLREGQWLGEARHRTKDGRELIVEARSALVLAQDGQPKSVIAINTDITERKQIEAQFLRAQRMESLGTLAGGIAHDLNNILAPIMMSIEILAESTTDEVALSTLGTLRTSTQRGADIVRQVLSFARGFEGERAPIDPSRLVRDIKTIVVETFPKDIQLDVTFPPKCWTVLGDPTQLHQVLLNLCVNARDAMPRGGRLSIAIENTTLDAQYTATHLDAKPGRYSVISVSDTGTGIPREILDKIFEPFFTTKGLGYGTGLGLSTVISIVKSHHGFVNVYSEVGRGTTFKIFLPARDTSAAAPTETSLLATLPRGHGETVLIIDDEASILVISSQTLEAFGYRVLTAINGSDAVALYESNRELISVVMTDMSMPVMNGPDTIRALRAINPAVKIIGASGLKPGAMDHPDADLEIQAFLNKPFTAETLLTTLRKVIGETAPGTSPA